MKSIVNTVLIIPPNDPEAVLISQIAEKMGLAMITSRQGHGASLDKGKDVVPLVRKDGYKEVVVVEMPGLKTEERLKKLGVKLVIIDHHEYEGLDRGWHPRTGKRMPSSLEQFLKHFRMTDTDLQKMGFDPVLVKGVGIMDRGFVWALQEEGYARKEVRQVIAYWNELLAPFIDPKTEARKQTAVERAWAKREKWNGYYIVKTRADLQLRPRISMLIAQEIGKPVPLIIQEVRRGLIYVQESLQAQELFKRFGGFTYGSGNNWGIKYKQSGGTQITLQMVKDVLTEGV